MNRLGADGTGFRLSSGEILDWLGRLLSDGKRVIAPVEEAGLRLFRAVASKDEICLAPGKARLSPKDSLFPKNERLFAYTVRGEEVSLETKAAGKEEQVLFGARPCDVAGLLRLDTVFLKGRPDAQYAERRSRTAIVSLACDSAEPECFCTAVGVGPGAEEGSDVQVLAAGERWLVRPLTPKGETLTASLAGRPAPSEEEWAQARSGIERAEANLRRNPVAREWAAVLEANFDLPLWEAVGQRCVGCSICNFLCPSCSCFDVHDGGNAFCGERCRSWDSCTFATFTRHGSGHNPRPNQPSRYRQRVLHKFAYYPQSNAGEFMCVGCGRCVRHCPVGLSIYEAVNQVATAAPEAS
jgi:formate hydrogenlyase subunit 6/NADH:ubiquinone oxidoreductase subunit I